MELALIMSAALRLVATQAGEILRCAQDDREGAQDDRREEAH